MSVWTDCCCVDLTNLGVEGRGGGGGGGAVQFVIDGIFHLFACFIVSVFVAFVWFVG